MSTFTQDMLQEAINKVKPVQQSLLSFKTIENKHMCKHVQKKSSRFKIINRLYRKLFGYYEVPDEHYYVDKVRGSIIAHPETLKLLIREVERRDR